MDKTVAGIIAWIMLGSVVTVLAMLGVVWWQALIVVSVYNIVMGFVRQATA